MSIGSGIRTRGGREIAAIALFLVAYLAWQVCGWGGPGDRKTIGDLSIIPISIGAALIATRAGHRTLGAPRLSRGWRLIAFGLLCFTAGEVVQAVYELGLHMAASPSLADPAYLLFYPSVLAGVLSFPTEKPLGSYRRTAVGIDLATVAIAGGAVVWYLLLGPKAFIGGHHVVQTLLAIGYPVGDLLLVCALAQVLVRQATTDARWTLYRLGLGVLVFVGADLAWGWMSINSIYTGGDWVDVPYVVSIAIFAVAAICQTRPGMASASQRPARHGITGVLPYLAPLLILGLITLAECDHRRGPELILIGVTAIVMVLAVVRQFLAQREVVAANRALGDANAEISALAATDGLTGLPNHRTMVAALDLELERAARFGRCCAVLFIDVDHFKALNDTLGHAAGDQVLSEIGHLLRAAVRAIDTIGRWGGEEFVAIVPESDADAALATAVRIADAIRNHTFVATRGRHVTCSIGVAAYPQNGTLRGAVLESADRAMYAAKRAGRDRACHAPALASTTPPPNCARA